MSSVSAVTVWLAQTPWSIALHESLYAYTLIESAHVIGIMLFVGMVVMLDLRLLGLAWKRVPISQMSARTLPWTAAGFALMMGTGSLLFYAIPIRTWHSVWFRAKMLLIVVAVINSWVFHRRAGEFRPRRTAVISLIAWLGVIGTGRMIAYDWFDCDKPQSPLVYAAAGCSAYPKSEDIGEMPPAAAANPVGATITRSMWLFPAIESVHLLGIALLGGAVLMVSLRLLGLGLTLEAVSTVERDARPWLISALALLLVSGILMGLRETQKLSGSPAFAVKMAALAAALVFTFAVMRPLARRDVTGLPAKTIAVVSIALWLAVALAGRWIGFS